ncbi:MAG TPA: hypothetical protein VLE96_02435 [Chlamydiales bacterium]|nr:hypothetical protein [Chlamydiales bacterium]
MNLRVSEPSIEGVFQASKWLKIQVLLDCDEMKKLILSLGNFSIFPIGGVGDGKSFDHDFFAAEYCQWIEALKQGIVPNPSVKAVVFVEDLDALWLQKVGPEKYLTKMSQPVVHVQSHYFAYSEGVFRPMSMGLKSIFWGLQFSFPQLYQDPKTMEFHTVKEGALFRKIQLWMREHTRATPFIVDGKKINSSIRIGKKCLSWIASHPQLIEQNIRVQVNISSHGHL